MKNRRPALFILMGLIAGVSCSFGIFSVMKSGSNQQQTPAVIPDNSPHVTAGEPVSAKTSPVKKQKPVIKPEAEEEYYYVDHNSPAYDSLLALMKEEEQIKTDEIYSSDVNVLHEEMIAIREISLIIKTAKSKTSKPDSVIASRMNLKEETVPSAYTLEIWRSPLNTAGYRMGKNKLALYGIDPRAELVLYETGSGMYLKSGNSYYPVEKSAEFRNLRQVTDTALIRKIED